MSEKMARYIFVLLALTAIASETLYIVRLRDTVNALIDLNHDKSLYIDGGCPGRFQGSEEQLSTEGK